MSLRCGEEGKTHAIATGRFVRSPKVSVAIPETAAVAVTRSLRTSRPQGQRGRKRGYEATDLPCRRHTQEHHRKPVYPLGHTCTYPPSARGERH